MRPAHPVLDALMYVPTCTLITAPRASMSPNPSGFLWSCTCGACFLFWRRVLVLALPSFQYRPISAAVRTGGCHKGCVVRNVAPS